MSIVVAGTFRVPAERFEDLRPHLEAVIAASRGEDGCLAYSYAHDVEDPELIRVFEQWRGQAALDAHFRAPHMLTWQKVRVEHGFHDRRIWSYAVGEERESPYKCHAGFAQRRPGSIDAAQLTEALTPQLIPAISAHGSRTSASRFPG